MEQQRISWLLSRYADGQLTEQERQELTAYSLGSDTAADFKEQVAAMMETGTAAEIVREEWAPVLSNILATDKALTSTAPVHRIRLIQQYWVAAAVLLLLGTGGYFWLISKNNTGSKQPVVANTVDIAPGHDGAVLTLSDGRHILLDSLSDGLITTQNGSRVLLKNGQLVYDPAEKSPGEIVYNIMSTPIGRQFQLILPDGSKVWLNAGSSIRYPAVFAGNERNVEIVGEVWFDVVPQKNKPFKVNIRNQLTLEVLGTQFNVNAYENEAETYTTLLQGAVKLSTNNSGDAILKPGQQAMLGIKQPATNLQVSTLDEAALNRITAWKSGFFNFEGISLQEAMRQLERWYNIEVSYENGIPAINFWGKMERSLSLESLLQTLKGSKLQFRREGDRKLVIINASSSQ